MLLLVVYCPEKKTLCCLVFNDGCTGIQANTQDRMEDPEEHEPPHSDALESPREPDEQGGQRTAVMHPPDFLARISQPASGLGTVVPCTLSIPGCWASPKISDIGMK